MGNCQAAETATVVIQHPGSNKVDRIYWSVTAHEVMSANPGHYVAMVLSSPPPGTTANGTPVRQMKLLRPDDMLLLGHVYRLISFEDVLKESATKKCVKLGKLLKERGALNMEPNHGRGPQSNSKSKSANGGSTSTFIQKVQHEIQTSRARRSDGGGSIRPLGRLHSGGGGGHWRPALQSIAEIGT